MPPDPGATGPEDAGREKFDPAGGDEAGYLQCMAARGDTVQILAGYAAASPYAYGAPYGYGYPFGISDFYGGLGIGWGYGRWHQGGWHHAIGGRGHAGFGRGAGGHAGGGHR